MVLPQCFCWSRFGTEAGQLIGDIIARKEQERRANGGVFLWGIGSALRPSMTELVRRTKDPEVLFSPIKSQARNQDVEPVAVAAWTCGVTIDGGRYILPAHSLVTSRYDPRAPRKSHYALVCFSSQALCVSESVGSIDIAAIRNILTNRPVGASQVTAVVQCVSVRRRDSRSYGVAMRVRLVYPYFVKLTHPVPIERLEPPLMWSERVRQEWRTEQTSLFADCSQGRR